MNCKNCDATLDGKFCSHCGQKSDVHRVTVGHVAHEFIHALTHTDKGFLLLIKDLFRKPGVVAREYLEGKRKKYFNPISFLVITTAISALIAHQSGYYDTLAHKPATNTREVFLYSKEVFLISINHGKLLGLILTAPLYTFLSWVFFRRPHYNFAEHFVLQSYTIGLLNVVTAVVFIPAFLLFPSTAKLNNDILHVLYMIYMGFAYKQFFSKRYLIWPLVKSIVMTVLFIVLFWFVIWLFVAAKHLIMG
jgi:hypothetical protein